MRKLRLASTALAFVVASAISGATAQSYPTRPISVVVPFPPKWWPIIKAANIKAE